MVNKQEMARFVTILRSGKYEQYFGGYFGTKHNQACALGCWLLENNVERCIPKYSSEYFEMLEKAIHKLFSGACGLCEDWGMIASLNDDRKTFNEIAEYLEKKYLSGYVPNEDLIKEQVCEQLCLV